MMRLTTFVLVSMIAACSWGEGSGSDDEPRLDSGVGTQVVCGDGVCSSSEVNSCPSDCGGGGNTQPVCGDGSCTGTETPNSCASDCSNGNGGSGSGSGSGSNAACPADPITACICIIFDPSTCAPGITEELCVMCVAGGSGI